MNTSISHLDFNTDSSKFCFLSKCFVAKILLFAFLLSTNCFQLHAAIFDKRSGAAGILPFAYHEGKNFVLLGREGAGSDKGSWCDFGGKSDRGETLIQAAVREFLEETNHAYGDSKDTCFRQQLEDKIRGSKFSQCAISINDTYNPGKFSYVMIPVSVEYLPAQKIGIHPSSSAHSREKDGLRWVPADDFFRCVQGGGKAKDQKQAWCDLLSRQEGDYWLQRQYAKQGGLRTGMFNLLSSHDKQALAEFQNMLKEVEDAPVICAAAPAEKKVSGKKHNDVSTQSLGSKKSSTAAGNHRMPLLVGIGGISLVVAAMATSSIRKKTDTCGHQISAQDALLYTPIAEEEKLVADADLPSVFGKLRHYR